MKQTDVDNRPAWRSQCPLFPSIFTFIGKDVSVSVWKCPYWCQPSHLWTYMDTQLNTRTHFLWNISKIHSQGNYTVSQCHSKAVLLPTVLLQDSTQTLLWQPTQLVPPTTPHTHTHTDLMKPSATQSGLQRRSKRGLTKERETLHSSRDGLGYCAIWSSKGGPGPTNKHTLT